MKIKTNAHLTSSSPFRYRMNMMNQIILSTLLLSRISFRAISWTERQKILGDWALWSRIAISISESNTLFIIFILILCAFKSHGIILFSQFILLAFGFRFSLPNRLQLSTNIFGFVFGNRLFVSIFYLRNKKKKQNCHHHKSSDRIPKHSLCTAFGYAVVIVQIWCDQWIYCLFGIFCLRAMFRRIFTFGRWSHETNAVYWAGAIKLFDQPVWTSDDVTCNMQSTKCCWLLANSIWMWIIAWYLCYYWLIQTI